MTRDGTVLEAKKWQHLKDAKALAYSCYRMYEATPTGLSGEYVEYSDTSDPFLPRTTRRVRSATVVTVAVTVAQPLLPL